MHSAIQFYIDRDGLESARESIGLRLRVYLQALVSSNSHASQPDYRDGFIDDAIAYAQFLGEADAALVLESLVRAVRTSQQSAQGRQAAFNEQLLAARGDSVPEVLEQLRPIPLRRDGSVPASTSTQDRLDAALERLRAHGINTEDI